MGMQKRVKGHLRKVPGSRRKMRVRGHLRRRRTDIKLRGKGR
ncbi:hypothetical protein LCGC14_0548100 [marine sediment metagenome]|uniref:Uncharacterized protein n=1 Tax=marine sediment metagenome TaxID=412755 RepID=A0A0F9RVH5_9ZZZZ